MKFQTIRTAMLALALTGPMFLFGREDSKAQRVQNDAQHDIATSRAVQQGKGGEATRSDQESRGNSYRSEDDTARRAPGTHIANYGDSAFRK